MVIHSFLLGIQKPRAIKLRFCQTFLVPNVIVHYFMSKHCSAKSSVALHRPFWHRKKSAILSVKTMPYTLYTLNRANSPKLKPFRKIKRILLDFTGKLKPNRVTIRNFRYLYLSMSWEITQHHKSKHADLVVYFQRLFSLLVGPQWLLVSLEMSSKPFPSHWVIQRYL